MRQMERMGTAGEDTTSEIGMPLLPVYACSSPSMLSLSLGNPQPRGVVLWPSPPASFNHCPIAADRPSSNRTTSHPPAEKADRAQWTGPAKRIVGPRGWGSQYASSHGTSRAIAWSSVCESTGPSRARKADERAETREGKSDEGNRLEIPNGGRPSVRIYQQTLPKSLRNGVAF